MWTQAPRAWYDKLKFALLQWGFPNSKSDTFLFYCKHSDKVLLVLIYVDDILITGSDQHQVTKLIADLNKQFALKTLGSMSYFLGFEAYRDEIGLYLTHHKYIQDLLTKTKLIQAKPVCTPMFYNQKLALKDSKLFDNPTIYRSIVGAL